MAIPPSTAPAGASELGAYAEADQVTGIGTAAQQLPDLPCRFLELQAEDGNPDDLLIGGDGTKLHRRLGVGETISVPVRNANVFWVKLASGSGGTLNILRVL